jgi:hypothetical protein
MCQQIAYQAQNSDGMFIPIEMLQRMIELTLLG